MSLNLQNCVKELQLIGKLKNLKTRKQVLNQLSKKACIYQALKEISQNIINKNIKLTASRRKVLLRHSKIIKALSRDRHGKAYKQRLVRQSGGFIPAILPALLPILASIGGALFNGSRS
jgi:hypothetical protein